MRDHQGLEERNPEGQPGEGYAGLTEGNPQKRLIWVEWRKGRLSESPWLSERGGIEGQVAQLLPDGLGLDPPSLNNSQL